MTDRATEWDRSHLWCFRAQLLSVTDGDTCIVLADTGFRGRHEVKIRLEDVWAPELKLPGGDLAKSRLEHILMSGDSTTPWPLRVITTQRETVVSEVMSFERYVAHLAIIEPGTYILKDVAEMMADYGYGNPDA